MFKSSAIRSGKPFSEASVFLGFRSDGSTPPLVKLGFALRSSMGWLRSSNVSKIQKIELAGSTEQLSFQSFGGWVALLASACFGATPNPSFNGTGLRPAR